MTNQAPVEWRHNRGLVPYDDAVEFMDRRVQEIREGRAPATVWLLEHPALYTAGTSADAQELLDPGRFPVHRSGRGGRYTYHGPGQRVAYVMLDLKERGADVRAFVGDLEEWLIRTLARFGVRGGRRAGRVGIWVERRGAGGVREDKIAAIGVRIRHWVTLHGVSLNVDPDLEHFQGIVPCGIEGHGVTSLAELGVKAAMADVDAALEAEFGAVFGALPGVQNELVE
ncbi:MAG: lipoyl(octanoyl) transferase LipB [Rhodospirillales bacterium]|nr:lipoyl(octanoyl) transferase LipB [Rhodospirillales bacterium]